MQIVGVAPVGARSLRGVAAVTTPPPPLGPADAPVDPARFAEQARVAIETVVLPRNGAALDHRDDQLRRREARQAYREHGGDPPPTPEGPHPRGRRL